MRNTTHLTHIANPIAVYPKVPTGKVRYTRQRDTLWESAEGSGMMNAPVMMLVLASGLFSAMWSSDHPPTPGPQMMADRTKQPRHQPVPVVAARSEPDEEPGRADHVVESSTAGSRLQPVRAVRPRARVAVNADRPTDQSIGWTTSLFQEMAGSGRPLKTMLDEITKASASSEQVIGDESRRADQIWLTVTRESLQQLWTRYQRAREVSQRAQRTARQ